MLIPNSAAQQSSTIVSKLCLCYTSIVVQLGLMWSTTASIPVLTRGRATTIVKVVYGPEKAQKFHFEDWHSF